MSSRSALPRLRAGALAYRTAPRQNHHLSQVPFLARMPGKSRVKEDRQTGHDHRHHGPHGCVCPGVFGVITTVGGTGPVANDSRHFGRGSADHLDTGGPEDTWISTRTQTVVLPAGAGRLPGGLGGIIPEPLPRLGSPLGKLRRFAEHPVHCGSASRSAIATGGSRRGHVGGPSCEPTMEARTELDGLDGAVVWVSTGSWRVWS